ncbi:heterogeneous nuclear ribonucleoprotein L-like [Ctenocephalides felis]|uniref:heterogeneous nuclear ribonucleoprotein L-like n=1 Tax=Ctenocephalides felis TaxID=7515 RepID=UPI000E6E16E3|nr:heterogeneous nuclear ribonucleoprotein L-like [Ctenocephalides felis]
MAFNINNGSVAYNKRQRTENDEEYNKVGHGANGVEELRRKPRQSEPAPPNHVLLLTIFNPVYPITVDVLHTICVQHGKVVRIVIFKKNGVQAMVEFDCLESATRAKEALNSADIYSGCCTLKIDYAKPEKLNVHKNDSESWDYTINTDSKDAMDGRNGRSQPLLQKPHFGGRPQPYSKLFFNINVVWCGVFA